MIDDYKAKIINTNTTVEQANIIMDTQAEKQARQNAWWTDLKISVFNATQAFIPAFDVMGKGLTTVSAVAPGLLLMSDGFKWLAAAETKEMIVKQASLAWTKISIISTAAWGSVVGVATGKISLITAATALWNAVLAVNPLVWIIGLIAGLVAAIVVCWNKFEGFRMIVYGLWETFKQVFTNIGNFFKIIFSPIFEAITAIKAGNWGDAAKAIGKGLYNISPVGLAVNATKFAIDGGFTAGINDAWQKGKIIGASSWQNSQAGANQKTDALSAIASATAGISTGMAPTPAMAMGNKTISEGTSNKTININIAKMGVDQLTLQSQNVKEGAQQIRDIVLEELIRVTQSAKLMA
ncbi:MAG: hypothetical protein HC896_00030 [Bacteroidales bacterium]|nr:hypothetical protein [Bacteroidales bacterium]